MGLSKMRASAAFSLALAMTSATIIELPASWDGRDARGKRVCLVRNEHAWFVDLYPAANWGHPCLYVSTSPNGLVYVEQHDMPPRSFADAATT